MGLDLYFEKVNRSELGYFRKVNFLISFFESRGYEVENLKRFSISLEDAEDLLDRCNKVLEDPEKGPELLPTQEGFFFGKTSYSNYYLDDVIDVKHFCEEKLIPTLEKEENVEFHVWY